MKSNQIKPIGPSMLSVQCWMLNVAALAIAASALADVHYVDVNSTNATPPYIGWATAATNIQDAVDAAVAGDDIVVTNGLYASGRHVVGRVANRVAVDKPLLVRSVNGALFTTIDGGHVARCVYMTDGASLFGFTLTNGGAGGAGFSDPSGGGGGAYGGTLNNCTLSGNAAEGVGGGACNSTLNNCTLTGNFAGVFGGGAAVCALNNCTLTGNNCGNYGGATFGGALNNCTLTGNSAGFGGGAYGGTLNNCIVYFNTAADGANYLSQPGGTVLNYCCTTPLPTNGMGNITNAPAFVNLAAGNYRLRADSPCIDTGTNLSTVITNDFDGRPRPVDGNGDGLAAFDMGAYEYPMPLLVWQDSPNPTPPYSSWSTAATNIQDAVDVAVAGDEIVVTNGTYATGGGRVVGPDDTFNRVAVDKPLSIRSVNGAEPTIIRGGCDVRCVYLTDAASLSGFTLSRGNLRYSSGGAAWGGTLNNCTLTRNSAFANGGGAIYSTLNNCVLTGNASGDMHRLCGLAAFDNLAANGGGASRCTLNNCTLSGNWTRGGWLSGGGDGSYGGILNNCIVLDGCLDSILNGCWRTEPLFVDEAAGNLRLQSNSPCINAGNPYVTSAIDLDGNPRIAGGTVDIGAYEFQSPASLISYAWLQQFNLPIDFSTDGADPDGDGVDNYHEWLAGTYPTNRFSSPAQLTIIPSSVPPSGIVLTWSTNAVGFRLQSATNLVSPTDWSTNPPVPFVVNGQNTVTNPILGPQQFYRLSQ